jgi:hypothetical protein
VNLGRVGEVGGVAFCEDVYHCPHGGAASFEARTPPDCQADVSGALVASATSTVGETV